MILGRLFVLTLFILKAGFCLYGCETEPKETFGRSITIQAVTVIGVLFDTPENDDGKNVLTEGVADLQDENGTWFYLRDKDARIFTDLIAAGFRIPDLSAQPLRVAGRVEVKRKTPSLPGKSVKGM